MKVTRLSTNPDWMAVASCARPGVDPEIFFAEVGGDHEQTTAAKFICSGCPVKTSCLGHALDHHIAHGVFAGLSPRQRQSLNQRRAAA